MNCFRAVQNQYGTLEKLFSGEGSFTTAARWHDAGSRTIYCSTNLQTSVSERAFHSITREIEFYNNAISKKGRSIPSSYFEAITKVTFKVGEIEILFPDRLIDLTAGNNLQKCLKDALLSPHAIEDVRKGAYRLSPPYWTRHLAKWLSDQKYLGFIAPSARTDHGDSVVFFEENMMATDYKILQISDLVISAISVSGKELKKGEVASTNTVSYSSPLGSGKSEILFL